MLINRLTSRSLHLLAFRVSEYLHLKPDAVLKHWACTKLTKPHSQALDKEPEELDEEVCKEIVAKFNEYGGKRISYVEVARKAWESGRTGLATRVSGLVAFDKRVIY